MNSTPPHRAIPAFDIDVFSPRASRYALAIFVINENGRLLRQLDRIKSINTGLDIILADGGSTDGSTERETLKALGVGVLLTKLGPGRLGAQMRMAFAWCLDRGYDGIIVMDGNNKDDPAALTSFVKALDRGVDHVQGSRFVPGGRAINTPLERYLAVRLLHAPLISIAARRHCTDTTNGFRAYSRRLLLDARVAPLRDCFNGYELHYYLQIRASRLGFSLCEVPTTRAYPSKGPTPTKITPFRGNFTVLRALAAATFGCFNPPPGSSQ